CISSTVDGIPEVVTDGERGLLVDPLDEPGIRDALQRVWRMARSKDPALQAMVRRAREFVSREHGVAVTAGKFMDEIRAVLRHVPDGRLPDLRTFDADRYVQGQLIQRWAIFKKDVDVECHIVRSHCHRFYEPS